MSEDWKTGIKRIDDLLVKHLDMVAEKVLDDWLFNGCSGKEFDGLLGIGSYTSAQFYSVKHTGMNRKQRRALNAK